MTFCTMWKVWPSKWIFIFFRSPESFIHHNFGLVLSPNTPLSTSMICSGRSPGMPRFGWRKYNSRGAWMPLRNAARISPTLTNHDLQSASCKARMIECLDVVGASVTISTLPRSGSFWPAIQSLAFGFAGTLGSAFLFA